MYSINTARGEIIKILNNLPGQEIVLVEEKKNLRVSKAINYKKLTGSCSVGDKVILNTTALDLELGTGGFHLIRENLSSDFNQSNKLKGKNEKPGHIMKLRYTPLQVQVLSVEEQDSPHREEVENFTSLSLSPVVILPLHSLLAPLAIIFKTCYPEKRLIYIMTEGGALPLELSDQVRKLKKKDYLAGTITIGQAFGGDLEAVNIFTGLAAAHNVLEADLIAVGMGPGLAGTGTRLGFSGMENILLDFAVKQLEGRSIFIPRVSLADPRPEHSPISHHTRTCLRYMTKGTEVVFPLHEEVCASLENKKLKAKHNLYFVSYSKEMTILKKCSHKFESMGRKLDDDPLFFITGGLPVTRYQVYEEE